MKITNYRLGIIGGMGPQASALLHTLVLDKYAKELGAVKTNDYPLILHISVPVIDFISDPEAIQKNNSLFDLASRLIDDAQLDSCIIACNTVNLVTDSNPSLNRLPLISLPKSVIAEAKAQKVKKLGLIASPSTIRTKLYEQYAEPEGIQIIALGEVLSGRVEKIIRATIAGKTGKTEISELNALAKDLIRRGAEAIALGCTELSVIAHRGRLRYPYIDSLTAAVNSLLKDIREKQETKNGKR